MEKIYSEKSVMIKIQKAYYCIFIMLLFSLSSFCQLNRDYGDTVFIIFENNRSLFVEKQIHSGHPEIRTIHYKYNYIPKSENCGVLNDNFWLRYSNYEDFDKFFEKEETLTFSVNKSFLKKNKSMLYTKSKLDKLGFCETHKILSNAKSIFLIDLEEVFDKKILIKKVSFQEEFTCVVEVPTVKKIKN